MIQSPKGLNDVLPGESHKWIYVESKFREICTTTGFREIRTPVFEYTKLFKRGVGETTDIVNKEMFSSIPSVDLRELRNGNKTIEKFFERIDKEGYTLKPEGTAPVVRSFVQNKLYADVQPTKLYYITPCFRHERHQAGRYRQFNQFGIETFGSKEASVDAEVISLANEYLLGLGLKTFTLKINSIGCPVCKPGYNKKLREFLEDKRGELCETCNDRIEKNPMRVIDCKNHHCQHVIRDVPFMIDNLCPECDTHFTALKSYLDAMDVEYRIDPKIVRGLDYYTKTAFEFVSTLLGAQSTVCGGGRYDGLVEDIDGPPTPGVGFGMGIERLLIMMNAEGIEIPGGSGFDCFIAVMGDKCKVEGIRLATRLRKSGIKTEIDHLDRSLKAQFKYADKIGASFVATIGESEIESGVFKMKNMKTGEHTELSLADIDSIVKTVKG